ncbi:MAG TPA: hypothetical protein PK081_04450 [Bacteroidales bacterium]|jgi:hypothetical protein|nr:hypothetical protein [Bacteroidales bacterium]
MIYQKKHLVGAIHEFLLMTRPLGRIAKDWILTTTFRSWDIKEKEWASALIIDDSQKNAL